MYTSVRIGRCRRLQFRCAFEQLCRNCFCEVVEITETLIRKDQAELLRKTMYYGVSGGLIYYLFISLLFTNIKNWYLLILWGWRNFPRFGDSGWTCVEFLSCLFDLQVILRQTDRIDPFARVWLGECKVQVSWHHTQEEKGANTF